MARYKLGRYEHTITSQGFANIGEKSSPAFVLGLKTNGRIDEADPDGALIAAPEGEGKVTLYLTEKAAPFTIAHLMKLGWNGVSLQDLDPSKPGHHSFVGSNVILAWKENGDYDDWEFPRQSQSIENNPGIAAKLDATLSKLLVRAPRAAATPRRATAPAVETVPPAGEPFTPSEDDDVPF